MTPTPYAIEQAMSAFQRARAQLALDPDLANDEAAMTALLGPLEGDVEDILARVLRAAAHAESMEDAAGEMLKNLTARRDRFRRRKEQCRATAFAIMDALGKRRADYPDVTASIAGGRSSVYIVDEAAIPDEFVKVSRTPDKAALLASLRQGEVIPGVELGNSLPTLQIRTK